MVDVNDVVLTRDEEGALVPEEVYVEEFDDTVVTVPMTNADQERWIKPFLNALATANAIAEEDVDLDELDEDEREELENMGREALSDEHLAEMFDEKIVEPDLVAAYDSNRPDRDIDALDEEFIKQDLKPGAKDGLLFAVLLASEMEEMVDALRSTAQPDDDGDEEESGNESQSQDAAA